MDVVGAAIIGYQIRIMFFCSIYKKVKNHKDILNAQFNSLKIIVKFLKKTGINKKKIKIKQPNDILIDNKKICGILVKAQNIKKFICI